MWISATNPTAPSALTKCASRRAMRRQISGIDWRTSPQPGSTQIGLARRDRIGHNSGRVANREASIVKRILTEPANAMLPLTTALSGVTLAIGLLACPMESARLQHAFLILSGVTLAGVIASLIRHHRRLEAFQRRIKFELALIPLAL